MDAKPGVTSSGPSRTIAEMMQPKRTRQEKAVLKKQNVAHAEILKQVTHDYREIIQDPQSEKQADYLELGLILDATKSMKPWITRAKETLGEIIDSVVAESKEDGENPLIVRVCFIGFRDHKDDERFSMCPFTEDIQVLKDFMNNCIAEGGKDIPEDVVGGLKMCLMQDWTKDSAKKVFLIGDAPCHGKKYTGDIDDHFPEGSPEGLTVEDLMKEYCKLDIEFSMIKLNNSVDTMIDAMRQHHQELDVKDMSSTQAEKILADHTMVMPSSSSYVTPAFGGSSYPGAVSGFSSSMEVADVSHGKSEMRGAVFKGKGGGGGGGGDGGESLPMGKMKMAKSDMMEMAMDREFASYAKMVSKGAVDRHRTKKKK